MHVIVNSQKDKGKALRKHILKDIVQRRFDARIEYLTSRVQGLEFTNKEERQAHQLAIEEKNVTIALLNDDLQKREYENVGLRAQKDVYQAELQKYQDVITYLETRFVPHGKNPGKDNIIIIVWKHTTLANVNFMTYHIISQGYNDVKDMLS